MSSRAIIKRALPLLFFMLVASPVNLTHAASVVPLAPAPTRSSAITTGRPEPVPIAFVYRDGRDQSAWTQSHERARAEVTQAFAGRIATIAVEHVATASDADRVFGELVARGYKVIFATDPVHANASARVALADFDVKIEQALGTQTLINVRTYEIRHVEQAYLAGIVAAGNSKSRKLGVIAAAASPAAVREINAFALGAQSVDKRAAVHVVWTAVANDTAADARAAETLIARGVDVLLSINDSDAAARVAERMRKRVIGWHVDRADVAPNAQVAALVLDWTPFYRLAVSESFAYLCTKNDTSRGVKEGAIKLLRLASTLSPRARGVLSRVQRELDRGEFQGLSEPVPAGTTAQRLRSGVSVVAITRA